MEQCLTANDNNVDAVVASNDGTAGGVVAALASQGLAGNIPVSGQDGDIAALNRISKGYQTVNVYAMGGNPEAAELAGIDVKKMTLLIFVISGILCAIAGAVSIARLNASPTSLGQFAEPNVIAAAVIGGASLSGGVGTVAGAILGALIMQSLQNGMLLMGITSAIQQMASAAVLLLAVWFDVVYQKRRLQVR